MTVSGERSRHVISEVASKDEEIVVMKVENATLVEKLKARSEEVSKFGNVSNKFFQFTLSIQSAKF